jgi:hypothetical protein
LQLPAHKLTLYQLAASHKRAPQLNISSSHIERTIQAMAGLGFQLATPRDIVAGRAAAAALVGDDIASAATMLRVQARSRCAVFIARAQDGAPIAAVSAIPLTCVGADMILRLDGLRPDPGLIARPADQPQAVYLWGAAGFTWRGRRLALAASLAIQRQAYPHLPLYARAATDDGDRALRQTMGASLLAGGLLAAPAWTTHRKAA